MAMESRCRAGTVAAWKGLEACGAFNILLAHYLYPMTHAIAGARIELTYPVAVPMRWNFRPALPIKKFGWF